MSYENAVYEPCSLKKVAMQRVLETVGPIDECATRRLDSIDSLQLFSKVVERCEHNLRKYGSRPERPSAFIMAMIRIEKAKLESNAAKSETAVVPSKFPSRESALKKKQVSQVPPATVNGSDRFKARTQRHEPLAVPPAMTMSDIFKAAKQHHGHQQAAFQKVREEATAPSVMIASANLSSNTIDKSESSFIIDEEAENSALVPLVNAVVQGDQNDSDEQTLPFIPTALAADAVEWHFLSLPPYTPPTDLKDIWSNDTSDGPRLNEPIWSLALGWSFENTLKI